MNIFVLHSDPIKAAQMQCDQHVVKMTLETAQLLCWAFAEGVAPYRRTHFNHPCSIWTRKSRGNFLWLCDHGDALAAEYSHKYDKTHRSAEVINWCRVNVDKIDFPQTKVTPFAVAMDDKFKRDDPVASYRAFYAGDKVRFARWEKTRPRPSWMK